MTPEQRLERIAEWAADEPSVSGLIVVGSRARTSTPADAYSDIDVVLVCREPERFIADDRWVEAFGTPLLTFVELTALRDRQERRVLYDDGGDVDLVPITDEEAEAILASSAARDIVGRGVRILVDEGGSLAEQLNRNPPDEATPSAWPPPAAEVANLIGDFWYHVLWTARKLRRGELWIALECLNSNQLHILRRFMEWEALAASEGQTDVWFRGRYLERWAPPETLERFREATATYDPIDVRRALLAGADLFAALAPPIAAMVGARYPAEAERRVRQLVADILG